MSADSPIIKKELREYVDILGYSESELLKKNREETKKLGPISIICLLYTSDAADD